MKPGGRFLLLACDPARNNTKTSEQVYPPQDGHDLWEGQQVISRPEVHSLELTEADHFLIMACDGVWDVLSNQEAVSFVHRRLLTHRDVQRAAVELIDKVNIDNQTLSRG